MTAVKVKEIKKTKRNLTEHRFDYIYGDRVKLLLVTACTSYETRMYSYLLILTQCRNCNKDKWQKKYEVDVREDSLLESSKSCSDHEHEGWETGSRLLWLRERGTEPLEIQRGNKRGKEIRLRHRPTMNVEQTLWENVIQGFKMQHMFEVYPKQS